MRVYFCRYVTSKISIWAWSKFVRVLDLQILPFLATGHVIFGALVCDSPAPIRIHLKSLASDWGKGWHPYPWNTWNILQWLKVAMDPCPFLDDLLITSLWFSSSLWFVLPASFWHLVPPLAHWFWGAGATGTPWLLPIQGPPYCRKRQQKMAARWARWGQEAPPDGWKNQYHKLKIQRMVNVGCTSQGVYFHVQFWGMILKPRMILQPKPDDSETKTDDSATKNDSETKKKWFWNQGWFRNQGHLETKMAWFSNEAVNT